MGNTKDKEAVEFLRDLVWIAKYWQGSASENSHLIKEINAGKYIWKKHGGLWAQADAVIDHMEKRIGL